MSTSKQKHTYFSTALESGNRLWWRAPCQDYPRNTDIWNGAFSDSPALHLISLLIVSYKTRLLNESQSRMLILGFLLINKVRKVNDKAKKIKNDRNI